MTAAPLRPDFCGALTRPQLKTTRGHASGVGAVLAGCARLKRDGAGEFAMKKVAVGPVWQRPLGLWVGRRAAFRRGVS